MISSNLRIVAIATLAIALMMAAAATGNGNGIKPVYASKSVCGSSVCNPNLDKEEFDITVQNIQHKSIDVAVTINGKVHTHHIKGNPGIIDAPTQQIIILKFARNLSGPTPFPIKLGDEYTPCIRHHDSQSSCLRSSVDSLTQPQKKTLDANYIPD